MTSYTTCLSIKWFVINWWTCISLSWFLLLLSWSLLLLPWFLLFLLLIWILFLFFWFRSLFFIFLLFWFWFFLLQRLFVFGKNRFRIWFGVSFRFNIIENFFLFFRMSFINVHFDPPLSRFVITDPSFCLILSQSCKPLISSSNYFFHFHKFLFIHGRSRFYLTAIFLFNLNRFLSKLLFPSSKSFIKIIILFFNYLTDLRLFLLPLLSLLI